MKIIGIVGSRRRDSQADFIAVKTVFLQIYEKGDTICSGLCSRGGDRFAVVLSEQFQTPTKWFPAKWDELGKAAGFIRNTDIAQTSDVLIACVAKDRTGGTEDTIKKFLKFHPNGKLILV